MATQRGIKIDDQIENSSLLWCRKLYHLVSGTNFQTIKSKQSRVDGKRTEKRRARSGEVRQVPMAEEIYKRCETSI